MPPVRRAEKLQKRAAKANFDWPNADGVFAKLHEEIAELEEAYHDGDATGVQG